MYISDNKLTYNLYKEFLQIKKKKILNPTEKCTDTNKNFLEEAY